MNGMTVFLDSGAPSLYNKFARINKGASFMGSFLKDRKEDDFSFIQSENYLKYRQNYIDFLKQNHRRLDTYVNLDIINNAEETWKNQCLLEKEGLKPLPVFHLGEDIKWLKHYISKRYDYMAIGGLIPNPYKVLAPALDEIWSKHLVDKKGYPIIKVHGFALTSARLMIRYPWYSVDSASWIKYSIYGVVVFPKLNRRRERNYRSSPEGVFFSNKSAKKFEDGGRHYDTFSPLEKEYFRKYLNEYGCDIGVSSFKEVDTEYELQDKEFWYDKANLIVEKVEKSGVSNSYSHRSKMNIIYFLELQRNQPEYPYPFLNKKQSLGVM